MRMPHWTRRLALFSSLLFGVGFSLGGCKLECRSDGGNSAKEVVDEIGDEVEDVADEAKGH